MVGEGVIINPTTTISLSVFDWIALLSGIASLVLAVLAIWLAVRFFISSKSAEKEVSNLLSKLEAQTQLLSKVNGKMLDKYVTYSTQPRQADETTILLTQLISGATSTNGLLNEGETVRNAQAMQEMTTLYIAVMYHAAITNVSLQPALPDDIGDLDSDAAWVKVLIERSYSDFMVAATWVDTNGRDYIAASTAKAYYDEIIGLESGSVKDTASVYSSRAQS